MKVTMSYLVDEEVFRQYQLPEVKGTGAPLAEAEKTHLLIQNGSC